MNSESVLIIIPAFNTADSICTLIGQVLDHASPDNILVIDDGSADETARLAEQTGVRIISHDVNLGKGAALKTGFRVALDEKYRYVLTMDADLQHPAKCVPDFLEVAASGCYDMVIGVRDRSEKMPPHRAFANFTTSILISLLTGVLIKDSQSGFRLISTRLIRSVSLRGERYDLESEMLLKAGLARFSIGEIAIPTVYDGSASSINPVVDGLRFLKLLRESLFW
ncbi:MAG: glycosyltransferase family 2 protein [candidate division Zixibacteria bacterium]|nr:glycosyltransferase family 2 protein [candidate division Zixibacteria bacterium]MBU1469654.1 glycosyltransferase family 2 protein [candidate division Zixibacteria bacterium]